MSEWYTYILICRDSSYYIGITNDLDRRLKMHNHGVAASWTRNRRPVQYAYAERHKNKSDARKRELELKGWRRSKKEALFELDTNLFKR